MKYAPKLIIAILCAILGQVTAAAYETKRLTDCIFSNIQNGDGLLDPKVKAFLKDREGFVWLATPSTVQRFDGKDFIAFAFDDGVRHSVNCMAQTPGGDILAGGKGLWRVDRLSRSLVRFAPALDAKVNAMAAVGSRILACADDGLYVVDADGSVTRLTGSRLTSIIADNHRRAYLLSPDSIFCLSDGRIESIGNAGIGSKFTCMANAGRALLVGTDGHGIMGFDKVTKCFSPLYDTSGERIAALACDNDKVVAGIKGSGIKVIDIPAGETSLSITSHPDARGMRLLDDNVAALMIDDLGIIWVGYDSYAGADYIQYRNKPFRLFSADGAIPYELAYTACRVDDSAKRFMTANGEYVCDASGVTFRKTGGDAAITGGEEVADSVTFAGRDNNGRDMVVIRRRQAYAFDEKLGRQRRICTPEDDHFLGVNIEKLLHDGNNNYWIIGSRGAIKANPDFSAYTLFSTTEGLTEPYATDGVIHRDTLWVTTPHGVYYMDVNASPDTIPTRITEILVNGQPVYPKHQRRIAAGEEISLAPDENNIEFHFATLSYDNPYKMVYEYKFEKAGDQASDDAYGGWRVLRGISHVGFKDLAPGRYAFAVRRQMDNDGAIEVRFQVDGASSLSAWTVGLAILVAAACAIAIFAYGRRRKGRADNGMMATDAADDAAEAADKYRYNNLSDEDAAAIAARLSGLMDSDRPYLNPDLKLSDVAKALDVTPQVLSQTLNTRLGIRFNDYINQLRINAFKQQLDGSDKSRFTLESLAARCGFNSYSTFIRAFKKAEGVTPNDYLRSRQ